MFTSIQDYQTIIHKEELKRIQSCEDAWIACVAAVGCIPCNGVYSGMTVKEAMVHHLRNLMKDQKKIKLLKDVLES